MQRSEIPPARDNFAGKRNCTVSAANCPQGEGQEGPSELRGVPLAKSNVDFAYLIRKGILLSNIRKA